MRQIRCAFVFHKSIFPLKGEPSWHARVDRWYQLDAPAFGLCELWSQAPTVEKPALIVLASPGGCNGSDALFALQGASSPARFVHTLPSLRASALLQLMNWHGPLICLQNDPHSLSRALSEGAEWVSLNQQVCWVLGCDADYVAYRFCLGGEGNMRLERGGAAAALPLDSEINVWLGKSNGEPTAALGGGWQITRAAGA